MTEVTGTAKVGAALTTVLGPIDTDVLLQNQSAQRMVVHLLPDMSDDALELPPLQRLVVPAGAGGVHAMAPMARGTQTYRLFYSSTPAAVTRG